MEDPKPLKFPVVAWSPFFERAKFRYWKAVGRGTTTIREDGMPQTDFYNDAHVSGGSIWTRILPEGETPKDQPEDAPDQPKRPAQSGQARDTDEEEV
jgi:hypothetical protein